jgi:hypothetical protein
VVSTFDGPRAFEGDGTADCGLVVGGVVLLEGTTSFPVKVREGGGGRREGEGSREGEGPTCARG